MFVKHARKVHRGTGKHLASKRSVIDAPGEEEVYSMNFDSSSIIALASILLSAVLAYLNYRSARVREKEQRIFESKRDAYNDFYFAMSSVPTAGEPCHRDLQPFVYACNKMTMFAPHHIADKVKKLADVMLYIMETTDEASLYAKYKHDPELARVPFEEDEHFKEANDQMRNLVCEIQNLIYDDMQEILK